MPWFLLPALCRWETVKHMFAPRYATIEVETWVGQSTPVTLRYDSVIRCAGRVVAEAQIKLACVGIDDGQLRRMPREVIEAALGQPR